MKHLVIVFGLLVSILLPFTAVAPAAAENCQFVLGFKAVHDLIPDTVGNCSVNEHHNPTNGDGLQETTGPTGAGGLLVWRKADNWTAYTDGYHTWVNGPAGLQKRLNTARFTWEADYAAVTNPPASQPTAQPTATPAPSGPARYSRQDFTALVTGKSTAQLLQILGKPSSVFQLTANGEGFWSYDKVTYDPTTGKVDTFVIVFIDGAGVATGVTFSA